MLAAHAVLARARLVTIASTATVTRRPISRDPNQDPGARATARGRGRGIMRGVDDLFDAWERAWSGRDTRAFDAVCAPEIHYEDPLTPEPLVGVKALKRHAKQLWAAMPDARVNSTGARLDNGTFACAPCRIIGTHDGELGRIHPTHKQITVHA